MNTLETRLRREEELDKIRAALDEGNITKKEYDAILAHDYGIVEEQTARWPIVAAALVILGVFGLFAMWGGTITGLVVFPTETTIEGGVYENNTVIALNTTNTTTVQISGALENGSANIYAQSNNQTYLVWSGTTNNNTIWLEKQQYSVNESIMLETELNNYSLWVIDTQGNRTPVQNNFTMNSGNYTLEVLADQKYEIDFSVGEKSVERIGRTEFVEACEETCELSGLSNVTLAITMSEGAKVTLNEIIVTVPSENVAPEQTAEIPTITVNETTTIDLSTYFNDTDDLTYEINNIIGVEETIDGSNLTLTSNNPGEYTATLYVSDLKAVTTANFDIVVVGEETVNETINETTNQTVNETNTTNETTNETTNQTVNETTQTNETNCSASDPNKRSLECLQNQTNYFVEQQILIEDVDRNIVGQFTPIGNLLITGDYVENSNATPGTRDWSIGILGEFGAYEATIWIDSDTGDLHLRGELIEANTNIVHEEGMYGMTNERGILLAKADRREGNLIIRGNIIPYRRSLG